MTKKYQVVEVAVLDATWTRGTLSYLVGDTSPSLGSLVSVPVRKRHTNGVVMSLNSPSQPNNLATISKVWDRKLTPYQLHIAKQIADYYLSPLGKAVGLYLPKGIYTNTKPDREILIAPLPDRVDNIDSVFPRSSKLKTAIQELSHIINWTKIKTKYNLSASDIVKLRESKLTKITAGDIALSNHQIHFLGADDMQVDYTAMHKLSTTQNLVWKKYKDEYAGGVRMFLLQGVTGSGKTEIYLHMAVEQALLGKQTLILTPEIILTPQQVRYFTRVFGRRIAVIHSRLTPREKMIEYARIENKEVDIIIGSRSALFFPFTDLGLIVIDEEQELSSYKNGETPRYSTRKVAMWLATALDAYLVLGSATPSLETYYATQQGWISSLELGSRI